MSTSKNSSKGASKGSQPPSRQGLTSKLLSKFESGLLRFGGSKEKPRESQSSTDNENPDGSKTVKVPSKGPDGKTVFKPKHLTICWQEESKYWRIPEGDDRPAELLEVCWLDVSGEMPVTKGKTYEVSFMLSMKTDNSFGWDVPVTVMARIGEEAEYTRVPIDLSKLSEEEKEFPLDGNCRVPEKSESKEEPREKKSQTKSESEEKSESKEEPREKNSQTKSKSDEKTESKEEPREKKSQTKSKSEENAKNDKETLYFGLYEVWTNKWKGGLRIHKAIVQEITDENNASTSITPTDQSRGKEIAAHDD